jgi:hypothetical protein
VYAKGHVCSVCTLLRETQEAKAGCMPEAGDRCLNHTQVVQW